jgi:hypothetical protein
MRFVFLDREVHKVISDKVLAITSLAVNERKKYYRHNMEELSLYVSLTDYRLQVCHIHAYHFRHRCSYIYL